MNILDIALTQAGGYEKLAKSLGVAENTVRAWRTRGVPRAWDLVLTKTYARAINAKLKTTEEAKE